MNRRIGTVEPVAALAYSLVVVVSLLAQSYRLIAQYGLAYTVWHIRSGIYGLAYTVLSGALAVSLQAHSPGTQSASSLSSTQSLLVPSLLQ